MMGINVTTNKKNKEEIRTSFTINKDDFEIFKDICREKFSQDPLNSGAKEAIADFNKKNKKHLQAKYDRLKELLDDDNHE